MARMTRVAFVAAVVVAVTAGGYAQDDTTGSAERGGRGRTAGARPSIGREFTTASFEQAWDRTQRRDLEAAGISAEKIEQLKQLQMEAESALSRGERPNFKAMSQRRDQILTREERTKLMDIRRERRQRSRGGETSASQTMPGAAASETTATGASE